MLNVECCDRAFTLIELMVVIAIIIILASIGLTVGTSLTRSNEINRTRTIMANAMQIATEYEVSVNGRVVNHLASRWPPNGLGGDPHSPTTDWRTNKDYNFPAGATGNSDRLRGNANNLDQDDPLGVQQRSIARFVWVTRRVKALETLYATFRPEALDRVIEGTGMTSGQTNGYLGILDAWRRPLVYAAFVLHDYDNDGNTYNDTMGDNDDDADDFLPRNDSYFFASAGPDGKWGHANADNISASELNQYKLPMESDPNARRRLREEASDNIYSLDALEVR
jgi:prepilin-type N-terminal cleavage/methylation domain-containing protein